MQEEKTIYIFNPESDYSLANFQPGYTAPASVVKLRRSLAFTPLRYARPDLDIVLLQDDVAVDSLISNLPESRRSRLPQIIPACEIRSFFESIKNNLDEYIITPWCWTPDLKHRLEIAGAPAQLLPSDDYLLTIRALAHRSVTIRFNNLLNQYLSEAGLSDKHISPLPREFFDPDDAIEFIEGKEDVFFKYPWSSSGRGILHHDYSSSKSKTAEWIKGAIRRQRSVMGETAMDKAIDFATEWDVKSGQPEFLGLSLFNADSNGKYHNNYVGSQSEILKRIQSICPDFDERYIKAQAEAIRQIATGYTGFLGIDMMAASDGSSRGCVELNFRMTMGIAAILEERINKEFNTGKYME